MNELYKILLLLGFILLFFLGGALRAFMKGEIPDKKEDLLREIRDELKKKNKKDEPLEGEVIE